MHVGCCGVLGASVFSGELKETCLYWLSCVMASMTDVDASFGTLNSIIPRCINAKYEGRFVGCVVSLKM